MSKKMPKLNSRYYGARAAKLLTPIGEAETAFRIDHQPSPHEVGEWRWGYAAGLVSHRLEFMLSSLKYCNRDELADMLADIEAVADKWGYTSLYDAVAGEEGVCDDLRH